MGAEVNNNIFWRTNQFKYRRSVFELLGRLFVDRDKKKKPAFLARSEYRDLVRDKYFNERMPMIWAKIVGNFKRIKKVNWKEVGWDEVLRPVKPSFNKNWGPLRLKVWIRPRVMQQLEKLHDIDRHSETNIRWDWIFNFLSWWHTQVPRGYYARERTYFWHVHKVVRQRKFFLKNRWKGPEDLNIAVYENAYFSHIISRIFKQSIFALSLNVIHYLDRRKTINSASHQRHIWLPHYKNKRFTYKSYFDMINVFFLQQFFKNVEFLVLDILIYTLFKMHVRNIKLKIFFYFINMFLRLTDFIRSKYSVYKIAVVGKIRGGTARTNKYVAGFGNLVPNSIGYPTNFTFDVLRSKYGSYGIKILNVEKQTILTGPKVGR